MIWDQVLAAMVAALEADTALATALGGTSTESRIGAIEDGEERRVPSVRYQIVGDSEEEVMNPILVQVDYWAPDRYVAATIEKRIRSVLHYPIRRTFGGIEMATLYEDSRDLDDPVPSVLHRSLDFRFVPVKRR